MTKAHSGIGKDVGKGTTTSSRSDLILEVISGSFAGEEIKYDRLFLFDHTGGGEKNWHFLILTGRRPEDRLELAAFSYRVDQRGVLEKKLKSRKAHIPVEKLGEVIDQLRERVDDSGGDYQVLDLSSCGNESLLLEKLRELLGEEQARDKL